MTVLYLVIPLALALVAVALAAFAWALRDGQFDDLHTPAVRILHDDEEDAGGADSASPRRPKAAPQNDQISEKVQR